MAADPPSEYRTGCDPRTLRDALGCFATGVTVVTCLDGYQWARGGRAGPALGMAAFASHHVRLALLPFRLDTDGTGYVACVREVERGVHPEFGPWERPVVQLFRLDRDGLKLLQESKVVNARDVQGLLSWTGRAAAAAGGRGRERTGRHPSRRAGCRRRRCWRP